MKSKIFLEMLKLTKGKRFQHLPGVLVDANGLTVTDLETSVTYRPVSSAESFTFDFDGKIEALAKSAKEIEFDGVKIVDGNDSRIVLCADSVTLNVPSLPVEEFPPIPGMAGKNAFEVFEMPWSEFCEKAIRATEFAAKEKVHFSLHGVYFDFPGENKAGNFVATDGRRLAILKGPETYHECKVIIPRAFFKTFYGITKIEKPEYVRFFVNKDDKGNVANVWIEAGNFIFNTLRIDGQFPNYMRALPTGESAMTTTIGPAQKSTIEKACKFADLGKGLEIYRNKLEVNGVEMPQAFEFDGALKFSPMIDPDFLADFTDEDFDVEFWGHDKCMMLHAQDACYAIMPICKRDGNPEYKLFETGELEAKPEVEETPAEKPAEATAA